MSTEKNNTKQDKKSTITFAISQENKKALKIYAAEKETRISALINQWIEENVSNIEAESVE